MVKFSSLVITLYLNRMGVDRNNIFYLYKKFYADIKIYLSIEEQVWEQVQWKMSLDVNSHSSLKDNTNL